VLFNKKTKLASFDIFDTVITRKVADPKAIFTLLGESLFQSEDLVQRFASLRADAEFQLRKKSNFQKEITLEEIYSAVHAELRDVLTPNWTAESLCALEMTEEKENLILLEKNLPLVHAAREKFGGVVFISDTYLPRTFICDVLSSLNVFDPKCDALFCSSEFGLMKSNGQLFPIVAEKISVPLKYFHHFGDNPVSDYQNPLALGMQATLLRESEPNRYEKPTSSPISSMEALWLGACRVSRIHSDAATAQHQTISDVASNIAAPLVTYFADWCLRKAKQDGVKKIFFLSRDGQIIRDVFDLITQTQSPAILGKYLYVSRQSLLLPAMGEDLEKELGWILAPTHILTTRMILSRVGIDIDALPPTLTLDGFRSQKDANLRGPEREQFRHLLTSSDLMPHILSARNKARKNILNYFKQEGLLDGDPFAIVDIGWNGTLQRSISRILELAMPSPPPIHGYYMGIRSRNIHKPSDTMSACFWDENSLQELDELGYFIPMLELFVSATHPGVVGYEQSCGVWKPLLRNSSCQSFWPLDVQHQAIKATAQKIIKFGGLLDSAPNKSFIIRNLKIFASDPTRNEASAYGSFLDAEDQNESYCYPLAQPYGLKQIRKIYRKPFLYHHNEWKAGCLALTNSLILKAAKQFFPGKSQQRYVACPPHVTLVSGYGPLEGPYENPPLPHFHWLYGPSASFKIKPKKKHNKLVVKLTTLFPNQAVTIRQDDRLLFTGPIPVLSKDAPHAAIAILIGQIHLQKCINMDFTSWDQSSPSRPLAAILLQLTLEK